ncbi:MAG: acyltransferase family protein [Gammaproteobacteria bacterium]|nr:acyltransferase family protein [Gammaproteobacteria bacterium]MBT4147608.1 acyltransferase family protein [Gammaproteobacteria bacterium]MBT5825856.1 acyltransferase family protein [Gammaproteobacteria bacterium]MBT6421040.1 acyltransferase family protein [Gammaproteobacteria bacterium]MBT6575508.1 acyltransferase family protein [Gammaproteobacteria bacterium]
MSCASGDYGACWAFLGCSLRFTCCGEKIAFAFGYYGIPLFFIISGFLLTASLFSILNNKHCSFTRATGLFLEKRILRIYPAYLVSLIIIVDP